MNITGQCALCMLFLISLSGTVFSGPRCATSDMFHYLRQSGMGGQHAAKTGNRAFPVQDNTAVRTMLTDDFALHYCLFGVHKVRIDPRDARLMDLVDSVYSSLSGLSSEAARQSRTYQVLDSMGAEHPLFIRRAGEYFQMARDYTVDTLGMRAPVSNEPSSAFQQPALSGKYHIEFAHIYEATGWDGEIYALTYPPGGGSTVLMDNDFLYSISGNRPEELDTIRSVYTGVSPSMVINYSLQWEHGIKVTASHEIYHSIQYAYDPNPAGYHYWFEASATGMEEQLAREVNDYLQYLPDLFRNHASYSINSPYYDRNETYASCIFHTFLTEELGVDFDSGVWQRLGDGQSADEALGSVISSAGSGMGDLFSRFVQPLMFTQDQDRSPFAGWSGDMDIWPLVEPLQLRLDTADTLDMSLPSLTWETVRLLGAPDTVWKLVRAVGASDLVVTTVYDGVPTVMGGMGEVSEFYLPVPGNSGAENLVLFTNGSWTRTALIEIRNVTDTSVLHHRRSNDPRSPVEVLALPLEDACTVLFRPVSVKKIVELYSVSGKQLHRSVLSPWQNRVTLSTAGYEKGLYYIRAVVEGNQFLRKVLL